MKVSLADFDDAQVLGLLRLHLAGMHDHSPACGVHALDISGLQADNVDLYCLWDKDTLLGFGALKHLSPSQGEVKSMRTHPDHLRRGVSTKILEYILSVAKARSYSRISLETGSGPAFDAAIALYQKYGFADGETFGDYVASDFNQFMHLDV